MLRYWRKGYFGYWYLLVSGAMNHFSPHRLRGQRCSAFRDTSEASTPICWKGTFSTWNCFISHFHSLFLVFFEYFLAGKLSDSNWTEEEDEQLRAAVKQYGEKNWQQVSRIFIEISGCELPGRADRAAVPPSVDQSPQALHPKGPLVSRRRYCTPRPLYS